MRRAYLLSAALAVALIVTGCGTTTRVFDLSAEHMRLAAAELKGARDSGGLPSTDRWAECFDKMAARLDALASKTQDIDKAQLAPALVLARLHIAHVQANTPPDADCAQVRLELLHEGIKLGASSLSGGGGDGALDILKALPLPIEQ